MMDRTRDESLFDQNAIRQKGGGTYVVRLGLVGGACSSEVLRQAADMADEFSDGSVHLTTRQTMEIANIPAERVSEAYAYMDRAGLPRARTGAALRGVVACPGQPACRFATGDTQGLARQIEERFADRTGLHTKLKVAVTGCPNSCAKPQVNDLGVMVAGKRGYRLSVGGRVGRSPRWATEVEPLAPSPEAVLAFVDLAIRWLSGCGRPKERFAAVLDRLGLDVFTREVTEPWMRACAAHPA